MPLVPRLPLTQCLSGPAPRVQLTTGFGPVPLLEASVRAVPCTLETFVRPSALSGAGAGGIALASPPPTLRQPDPRLLISIELPSTTEPENGNWGPGLSPGPPQLGEPSSVVKCTAPSGLAGGGHPGKRVEVVDVLV